MNEKTVGFNFLTYMRGSKAGSANYSQMHGDRGTWGVGAQFVGYGSMKETLETGEIIGDMNALDMLLCGTYSYELSDNWVGGVSGKFIYSHYGEFTSCAMAVDLGVSYFVNDEGQDFALAAAARNLGGQFKAFGNHHEHLPFDLEIGFTKGLGHAPVKISLTMIDMTRWSKKYYYSPQGTTKGGKVFMNHFNLGVDIVPTQIFYLSAGYNFRRANEMKAAGSSHAAGLSFGAGVNLNRFKIGLAYAKYHISAPSFSVSLTYGLQKGK